MIEKSEWDKTIMIGFLTENAQQNLDVYCKNFDIVLADKDANFNIVNDLILNKK